MPRASYQYGTSPRKYEPDYKTSTTTKKTTHKATLKKSEAKKRIEKQRAQKAKQKKSRVLQVIGVLGVFGMLLALSYREITIMEMFNQKKNLETQLATIQKENGQIEKSIREEESKLNWNDIKQTASEQLGMQTKTAVPVDLENQLSTIQKENGQIEKSIKEEESKLNWNEIKKVASEQLGMQAKTAVPVDLEKSDNVETTSKLIKQEETNIIEKIIEYFINRQ